MNTLHKAGLTMQPSDISIPEAEELIEEALENLAELEGAEVQRALRFLAPEGYQVVVELCSENGRSKRRGASASSWNPEEDEIRIYFERADEDAEDRTDRWNRASAPVPVSTGGRDGRRQASRAWAAVPEPLSPEAMDGAVEELCAALAEAERGGHAFIALKWFRDAFLPRKMYAWTRHPEQRQMILAESIQRGRVVTGKIPNPKSPTFPTTTIQLHREGSTTESHVTLEASESVMESVVESHGESA